MSERASVLRELSQVAVEHEATALLRVDLVGERGYAVQHYLAFKADGQVLDLENPDPSGVDGLTTYETWQEAEEAIAGSVAQWRREHAG